MRTVMVFAGAHEGNEVARWLGRRGRVHVLACVGTPYGAGQLAGAPGVECAVGPFSPERKEALLAGRDVCCIVDGTHPFATHISASVQRLAAAHGVPLLRVVREPAGAATDARAVPGVRGEGTTQPAPAPASPGEAPGTPGTPRVVRVATVEQAARAAAAEGGPVLATIGARGLSRFMAAYGPQAADNVWARVLASQESLAQAQAAGVLPQHVFAAQGPFSVDLNAALLAHARARVLVTKETGDAGGFSAKMEAAARAGALAVVLERPPAEAGYTLEQAKKELVETYGA